LKTFNLLKTNPLLTTNVKVVYSISEDKLYFESFNSNGALGDNRYKRKLIPEDSFYNRELAKYWKDTPTEISFKIKDNMDYDVMYSKYNNQIDDIYLSGASNVFNTDYTEEFEYLSPLHFVDEIPTNFIIFRVDGAGILDLNYTNFEEEILDKMKVVSSISLKKDSKLGKFLFNSFKENDIPKSSIDLNFESAEFTYWNGIDYQSGEFTRKGKLLQNEFKKEMTFTQGFQLLADGFKENNIIYPYIMNLNFLFDDTPADIDGLKKWSINRYMGFYGDLEEVSVITPYNPPILKSGLKLNSNNIFTKNGVPIDPFQRGYKDNKIYYVEYNSNFYLVKKISNTEFKVIADIDLPNDVDSNFNLNSIRFSNNNVIKDKEGNDIVITDSSDVLLIEINNQYHRLIKENNTWRILSDYTFTLNNNIFKYLINKSDPKYTTIINLNEVDENNSPLTFKIFRLNFSPIKNFDSDFLDTDFSKFEYILENDITNTEEPKLYEEDLSYSDIVKPVEKYIFNNKVVSIPTSSEYLSTGELFEVSNDSPNKLWRKNSPVIKFGIEGSNSVNDYPYLFNVNKTSDYFNRTTNTEELIPLRSSRNMDYFYTFASHSYNFDFSETVIHQSLNIYNDEGFNINKYFNNGYIDDYFDEIFGATQNNGGYIELSRKYSEILKGEQNYPNTTNFKGLDVSIYKVDSILTDVNQNKKNINNINIKGTNIFKDYKFSIILSDLKNDIDNNFEENDIDNNWKILKNWERNKQFNLNDIVLYDGTAFKDENNQYGFPGYGTESATGSVTPIAYTYPDGTIEELEIIENNESYTITPISATGVNNGQVQLYRCVSTSNITDPTLNIDNNSAWTAYPSLSYKTIFYDPNKSYTAMSDSASFSYLTSDDGFNKTFEKHLCFYKGEFYKCVKDIESSDLISPEYIGISIINGLRVPYWEKIEEYSTTRNYTKNEIVSYNGDLYFYNNVTQSITLLFTFKPDTNLTYNINDVILFNNNYYFDLSGNSTINNGINIYINKKWKNILIHIYFNDQIINVYNQKRDYLYKAENQQLVANNFINIINDITLKNGFVNNLKYYIIEEDGSFDSYNIDNIEDLPYLIQIETPIEIEYYKHSLKKIGNSDVLNIIKINKKLVNNKINGIEEINYLADQPISVNFRRLENLNFEDKTEILYRHGGFYNPIFKEIPIFDISSNNRYNFNVHLKGFGEIKEMVKSKVNENNNILKIKGDNFKSIYPQIDEIGYYIDNHNIFKSNWDTKYYKKTLNNI
jgi:hypothetical protein